MSSCLDPIVASAQVFSVMVVLLFAPCARLRFFQPTNFRPFPREHQNRASVLEQSASRELSFHLPLFNATHIESSD